MMKLQKIRYRKAADLIFEENRGEKQIIPVEYLGKGFFCTAWRNGSQVYLICRERAGEIDYSKDIIMNIRPRSAYLPLIEKLDTNDDSMLYRMPFYEKLTAKHTTAWKEYKTLKQISEDAQRDMSYEKMRGKRVTPQDVNNEIAKRIQTADVSRELKMLIQEIVDYMCNYGEHYGMEFSPRNLSVDKNGHLVLRDVIYNQKAIENYHDSRSKRAFQRYA
jgi:hypothetical protein